MGKLVQILVGESGLSEHDVLRIVSNAPVRYKTYVIKKRNGDGRIISQPARELKVLQRIIDERILAALPVHPSATAYRTGMSIKVNAQAHAASGPILKFDFKDFFPSITSKDWIAYCQKHSLFDNVDDIRISSNLLFRRPGGSSVLRLAIGAPSSPSLSNVLMYEFDTKVAEFVAKDRVVYTRYADDMTFSAKRTGFLNVVEPALKRIIREIESPSLTINESKTVLATRKYKRMVTGLILTNDGAVSIGYRRKRQVRAALHNHKHGRLALPGQARLAGLLAFINDVEPLFLARLRSKYGDELINQLKSLRVSRYSLG